MAERGVVVFLFEKLEMRAQTPETNQVPFDSLGSDARLLFEQGLGFLLVLNHLQCLPLRLDGELLHHLVEDHQGALLS